MKHYGDYVLEIVAEYNRKKSTGALSARLYRPTPARLREECLDVCRKRFDRKDENTLWIFFGGAGEIKAHLQAIERVEIDKFRPLINFLKRCDGDTDQKNIELLAWLIEFGPRPYHVWERNETLEQEVKQDLIDREEMNTVIDDTVEERHPEPKPKSVPVSSQNAYPKRRILIIATIIALFAGTVGYLSSNNPMSGDKISNKDSCMYWKYDHYERVSCGQKIKYAKVIALDTDLIDNFRRITNLETITYNSIGNVWYTKINGKPEFYTAMGYHPLYIQLELKPISKHIIDTHIRLNILSNDSVTSLIPTANAVDDAGQLKTPSPGRYGQCQALTKAKTRCSRNAKRDGYCWQHKKPGT